jgi:hypothetical protein
MGHAGQVLVVAAASFSPGDQRMGASVRGS